MKARHKKKIECSIHRNEHKWAYTNHGDEEEMNCDQLTAPTWRAKCRCVANHSRVAECTRLSPEGVYSGVS